MDAFSGTKDETTTRAAGEAITREPTPTDTSDTLGSAKSVLSHHALKCGDCDGALGGADFDALCPDGKAVMRDIIRLHLGRELLYPSPAIKRFLSHVDRSGGLLACHPWTLALDKDGYGDFWLETDVRIRAHRVALELFLGRRLKEDEVARHGTACVTRACCNGRHLSAGTPADNVADRDRDGHTAVGEKNGKSKLTAAAVVDIRARAAGGEKAPDIARSLGVGPRSVYRVLAGATWRHVAPAAVVSA